MRCTQNQWSERMGNWAIPMGEPFQTSHCSHIEILPNVFSKFCPPPFPWFLFQISISIQRNEDTKWTHLQVRQWLYYLHHSSTIKLISSLFSLKVVIKCANESKWSDEKRAVDRTNTVLGIVATHLLLLLISSIKSNHRYWRYRTHNGSGIVVMSLTISLMIVIIGIETTHPLLLLLLLIIIIILTPLIIIIVMKTIVMLQN